MLQVVISPAKKLDFETECDYEKATTPSFSKETDLLIKNLKKLNAFDVQKMMKLSDKLAQLNFERFQNFNKKHDHSNAKPAAFAFNGDTYSGLDFKTLKKAEQNFAQKHLVIISGLYGILKPFDLMQPYRLEMGTKFKFDGHKDLYSLWKPKLTPALNQNLKESDYLVNCASNEYFSSIDNTNLKPQIITPVFKENKNGVLKIISFNAKRARGMMARYIIQNKLKDPNDIKKFNVDNYKFDKKLSTDTEFVFTR